jgi:hypothetical protein
MICTSSNSLQVVIRFQLGTWADSTFYMIVRKRIHCGSIASLFTECGRKEGFNLPLVLNLKCMDM